MSSEKLRNWAWEAGERSSKMLYTLRTLLDERSVVVGRAVFLYLKTRDLMASEWSLTMTVDLAVFFLEGMAKELEMMK